LASNSDVAHKGKETNQTNKKNPTTTKTIRGGGGEKSSYLKV